ncbi:hemerythrin family protein [uncultured Cohaesibacter sp.]|uniref:bacteriohemerythrin n=1 Tax=uncultured Cohaesibacter sp. TaxID=1002546 RepID=UPI0029C968A7|nr:hemerythrin family protein [uncultured Cohaesibacter sp.]
MVLLTWDDSRHQLGVDEMDETHQEFADLVNRLGKETDKAAFQRLFVELFEHAKVHFEHEEHLMEESGFPALSEHRSEHARVLGQLNQINRMVQKGRITFGQSFVAGLPSWFDLHAATMDSALAAHLKTKSKRSSAR